MESRQMSEVQNYVIGRGRLFLDRFPDADTYTGEGERYLGNTPSLAMSATSTNLDHFSSEGGLKVKDKSVTLQRDLTGTFTCDNISIPNIALWFAGVESSAVQASSAGERFLEAFAVQKGRWYQIGATTAAPMGLADLTIIRAMVGVAVAATGTITFSGVGTASDTVTINGQAITLVASGATGFSANIGASETLTAQAVKAVINANPTTFLVSARGTAAVLTLTAHTPGTGGNALTLTELLTAGTVSGATLAGGTGSVTNLVLDTDWEYEQATGRFHILAAAPAVANGATVTVSYSKTAATRDIMVTGGTEAYGALRFVADNAVGDNKDYFWPYVKLTANGDYALKGDEWQQMSFGFEVLKLANRERVFVRDRA